MLEKSTFVDFRRLSSTYISYKVDFRRLSSTFVDFSSKPKPKPRDRPKAGPKVVQKCTFVHFSCTFGRAVPALPLFCQAFHRKVQKSAEKCRKVQKSALWRPFGPLLDHFWTTFGPLSDKTKPKHTRDRQRRSKSGPKVVRKCTFDHFRSGRSGPPSVSALDSQKSAEKCRKVQKSAEKCTFLVLVKVHFYKKCTKCTFATFLINERSRPQGRRSGRAGRSFHQNLSETDHFWTTFGPLLDHSNQGFGPLLDHFWTTFGPLLRQNQAKT